MSRQGPAKESPSLAARRQVTSVGARPGRAEGKLAGDPSAAGACWPAGSSARRFDGDGEYHVPKEQFEAMYVPQGCDRTRAC